MRSSELLAPSAPTPLFARRKENVSGVANPEVVVPKFRMGVVSEGPTTPTVPAATADELGMVRLGVVVLDTSNEYVRVARLAACTSPGVVTPDAKMILHAVPAAKVAVPTLIASKAKKSD